MGKEERHNPCKVVGFNSPRARETPGIPHVNKDSSTQPWFGILALLSEWLGSFKTPCYKKEGLKAFPQLPGNFANYPFQKGVFLFPPSPPFPPRPCMTSRHQMLMKVCQASRAVKWKLKILHYRMALKILSHVETSPGSSSSPAPSAADAAGLSLPNKLWTKFA